MTVVTIVIPTLNRQKYLEETIESCLNQTFKDIEIIVVDNASENPDINEKIVKNFKDDRLSYVYFNERLNIGGSWSRAIKLVKSPYAKLMCDDDILHLQYVEFAIEALEKHKKAVLFSTSCMKFSKELPLDFLKNKKEFNYWFIPKKAVSVLSYLDYVGGGMPSQTLFKTAIIKDEKPFDSEKFLDSPDSGCWINMFQHGGLIYSKDELCAERKHDGQAQKNWTLDHYKKVYTILKTTLWNYNLSQNVKKKLIEPERLVEVLSLAVRLSGRFKRSFKPKDVLLIADVYKFYIRKKNIKIKSLKKELEIYKIQDKCQENSIKIN